MLVRISIGNLRAIALLNNSQQVRSNFVISLLYIYQGELSGFMQKSQVFFDKVLQTLVKVRNNGCFRDLRAIESRAFPQSGGEFIPRLIAKVL